MPIKLIELIAGLLLIVATIPYIAKQYINAYTHIKEKALASRLVREKMIEASKEEE